MLEPNLKTLTCERLVFLTPSIEISVDKCFSLCVGPISKTRPYLRSCYISFENLLLEILEVTDLSIAQNFAFYQEALRLDRTTLMAIGFRVENLDAAIEECNKAGFPSGIFYINENPHYSKGFKHRSRGLLNLNWFGKMIYLSEYDSKFYQERESWMTTDKKKKDGLKVTNNLFSAASLRSPPSFLRMTNEIPELFLHTNKTDVSTRLDLEWIKLHLIK